jgi:hypothetical protein
MPLLRNSRKTRAVRPPEFLTLRWRYMVPFAVLSQTNSGQRPGRGEAL